LARRIPILNLAAALAGSIVTAQDTSSNQTQEPESKRVLGIIPNYRTSSMGQTYQPLTVSEKFKVASEDSLDRGTFALAGLFAGEAQLTNANRSFGPGAAGFGRYYGSAFWDFVIGDYMTEAVFPIRPADTLLTNLNDATGPTNRENLAGILKQTNKMIAHTSPKIDRITDQILLASQDADAAIRKPNP
jgi:hypothetical protein